MFHSRFMLWSFLKFLDNELAPAYKALSLKSHFRETHLLKIWLVKVYSLNLFPFSYANFLRAKIIKSQDTLAYKLLIEFNSSFEFTEQ